MALTFAAVIDSSGIDPADALVIRHAYVREHEDGTVGIHGGSSDEEVVTCTRAQPGSVSCWVAREGRVRLDLKPVQDRRRKVALTHDVSRIADRAVARIHADPAFAAQVAAH